MADGKSSGSLQNGPLWRGGIREGTSRCHDEKAGIAMS